MAAGESRCTATGPNMMGVGIIITAAVVVLILAGVMHAMLGVVGLATNEFYLMTGRWMFQFDVTTWGWVHVLVGLIGAGTGAAPLLGASWARILGVVIAAVSVIANITLASVLPAMGRHRHRVRRIRHLGVDRFLAGPQECVTPAASCTTGSNHRPGVRQDRGSTDLLLVLGP